MLEIKMLMEEKNFSIGERDISLRVTAVISYEAPSSNLKTLDMCKEFARKRNKSFEVYTKSHNQLKEYEENLQWIHKLKSAFKDKRIVAHYQPLYNYQTGTIERYEALVRLVDKDGDIVAPGLFLDAAHKAKLMTKLSERMVENSFNYFKEHKCGFSINLTVSDILNHEFVRYLLEKIISFGEGEKITLEILESEGIENFDKVKSFINKVKAYGCKIAIDDFGSGYANFENLLKLDADFIKIDGSLIRDIHINTDAYDIVEAIVNFARKKKIKTVAEFVSNQEIFECVHRLGIDYAQGYYIGKPLDSLTSNLDKIKHFTNDYKILVYVSESKTKIDYDKALKILNTSWKNNHDKGITGILIYEDFYFIEAIEGRPNEVDLLFEKISKDKRHQNIKLIGSKLSNQREFEEWNMGRTRNDVVIDHYFNDCGIERGSYLYKASLEKFLKLFNSLIGVV